MQKPKFDFHWRLYIFIYKYMQGKNVLHVQIIYVSRLKPAMLEMHRWKKVEMNKVILKWDGGTEVQIGPQVSHSQLLVPSWWQFSHLVALGAKRSHKILLCSSLVTFSIKYVFKFHPLHLKDCKDTQHYMKAIFRRQAHKECSFPLMIKKVK